MNKPHEQDLRNFKNCVQDAPEGTYEETKALDAVIVEIHDFLAEKLRDIGYKTDNCDKAFELEARIYQYVKACNPDRDVFPVSEGFGSAMDGPARERVISQASRDINALYSLALVKS